MSRSLLALALALAVSAPAFAAHNKVPEGSNLKSAPTSFKVIAKAHTPSKVARKSATNNEHDMANSITKSFVKGASEGIGASAARQGAGANAPAAE